jgi:DNA-binding IclR family transcriptional regulator
MGKSRAATRTVKIMELVAESSKGITLSEIAAALDIPINSVKDIITSLLELEMLEIIDTRSKLYGVGVKAFYIGNSFIKNTSIVDKAKPIIEELGASLNKTVFLAKELHETIAYIYKYEPKDYVIATCSIGSRAMMHCTSLGKSILAYDDELLKKIASKPLIKKTKYTITDSDMLYAEIEKVRQQGYAVDDREQVEQLLCIGAPIFDNTNKVVAALSISGIYDANMDVEKEAEIVKDKAAIISARLGYTK